MADVATPSGAAMFDAGGEKKGQVKPEKPDEAAYNASLKKAEKDHADSMAKFNAIRAKLDIAQPKSKDSPSAKRRSDLISQLKEIREKQASGKSGRKEIFDKIQKLDSTIKSDITAQKAARSKTSFKGVEDIDREIERLEKQVNGGMMKLVDEKKALAEISALRKQRKGFAGFEDSQKSIDAKKAELKKLRDTLDDPESRALSEKYNTIQAELDVIKAEQDDAFKNLNGLRDERTKLQAEQQEKYLAIKKLKDDFFQQNRAVRNWEFESRQRLREKKKTEDENYRKEKKKQHAQQVLTEASDKAYLDEIRRAESLLRFLDPSYAAEKTPLLAPSKFQAQAQRTVDDSAIKGAKVVSKKDREEDFFAAKESKKGKKNKKNVANGEAAPAGKYSCPPSVMEDCSAMGIDPPMSAADIPEVREKVKAKLDHWKADQDAQTERNIAKAKKELERLDAEDSAAGTPVTPGTPAHANGEGKNTAGVSEGGSVQTEIDLVKAAVADVAADLKGASIEDKA